MEQQTPSTPTPERDAEPKRPYEPPQVTVLDESDVLKVFQITSAGVSWWG